MKVDTHSLSPSRIVLSVVSEKEDTARVRAAVVAEYAKSAALPGFRKGKAPAAAVERAYGSRIRRDLVDRAIREGFDKAVADKGLKVYEIVSVEPQPLAEDGTLAFKATVDLVPEIELPSLEGVPVDGDDTAVTDAQVDERVEGIRKSFSTDAEIPAGEALAADDTATVDYAGTVDGKPLAEAVPDAGTFAANKNGWVSAGSEYSIVPGLARELLGKAVGSEGVLSVEFPADHYKESLRGVKAEYAWKILSAKRSIPAALDKALFKRLGVADEAALRARVREGLEANAKASDRARRMQQIVDFLVSSASFEAPAAALERETERLLGTLLERNMDRGVSKEDLSKERDRLTETARAAAEKNLRADLLLDAAGDKLGVELSNEEFTGYLNAVLARQRATPEQAKELTKDRAAMRAWFRRARREKVLSRILESAKPGAPAGAKA